MMKLKRWIAGTLVTALLLASLPIQALASSLSEAEDPELLTLTITTDSGQTASLLEEESVSIDLEGGYSFTASFSHPEQIEAVYITSTKGSAVRLLEAQWDESVSAFTTSGFFGGDEDYIPGNIGVEYTTVTKAVDMEEAVDWASMKEDLGSEVTAEITADTADRVQATVDLAALLQAEGQVAVDFAIDVFDETTGGNLNDWLGAYKDLDQLTEYVLDGGNYFLYLDYSDASTYAMILRDVSGNKYVKAVMKEAGSYSDTLRALSEQLGNLNTVSSLSYQFLTIQEGAEQLRDQVSGRTDLTGAEKEDLDQRIDAYENDRLLFTLSMTVIPAVVAASGGTMAGPALVFNALLGAINAASSYFWSYRIGMITGCEPVDTDFVSDAHGIPLTPELLNEIDRTITESGTYYLRWDTTLEIGVTGGPAVNVVLCTHGHDCEIQVNGGSSLELRDCTYEEDLDGNMISGSSNSEITNTGGHVTIREGHVNPIDTSESGYVTINGGTVSRVRAEGNGAKEIQINGGTVTNIWDNVGDLHITGGRVGQVINSGGTIEVTGGQVHRYYAGAAIQNESGTVIISSGVILGYGSDSSKRSAAIENSEDGILTITGGTLIGGNQNEATIENDGSLIIRDGELFCSEMSGETPCIDNRGRAEIFSGKFVGRINTAASDTDDGLIIHDGIFLATDTYNVRNNEGRLIIEGGNFSGTPYCNVRSQPSSAGNGAETIIRGGIFNCEGGNCIESEDTSALLNTVIEGGSFCSGTGSCVINQGNENISMTISGGTFISGDPPAFQGCVTNDGDGSLTITGGTFTCLDGAPCVYSNDNLNLAISGGTFLAPEGLSAIEGKGCTLLLGENSSIEISARFGLFREGFRTDSFQLSVETAPGYDGGVVYYGSPETDGVSMTASQIAAMDFSQDTYLRLECDRSLRGTSVDGISVSMTGEPGSLRTATVSASGTAVLVLGLQVWAASYADGKMTDVASGVLQADGTVTFSKPLAAGTVLFFLDGSGRPAYGSVLLQD